MVCQNSYSRCDSFPQGRLIGQKRLAFAKDLQPKLVVKLNWACTHGGECEQQGQRQQLIGTGKLKAREGPCFYLSG